MSSTTLAFLWHMHQPYYRNIATGDCAMPWVRLHGIHSYYDMLRLYEQFPHIKGTINFVPSLVEQLLAYTEAGASDAFLDHTLIPAAELTPQQKSYLLRHFFMANPERKIAPYPAYQRLLVRRGIDASRVDFNEAVRFFSTQDYLDLQVFSNLVWFGFSAKEEIPEIGSLLSRDGHFTEEEKTFVITAQKRILKQLFESLRRAAHASNVEICTTPYYHPIFPLLIDNSFAKRAMPNVSLPPTVKLPHIAREQLTMALNAMTRWTGKRPQGLWPAEGSVCPEMVPMLADAGLSWMATDDRVLGLSLKAPPNTDASHQPYTLAIDGKRIDILFRDHGLSDLIGFTYAKMPAEKAVDDFIGHIRTIDTKAKGEERLVTIILDGENPWESYAESGREFLSMLFTRLEKEAIPTATIGQYLRLHRPFQEISSLHTGSWIDANFRIWIGKPQKNTAWEYIKRSVDALGERLSTEKRAADPRVELAFKSLCAACSSDWFWWFDDDFDSASKADYDRIFRMHLKNAFSLIALDIPSFLFESIHTFAESAPENALPPGFMFPVIDGKKSSFLEWNNALRFGVRGYSSAMAPGAESLAAIFFGFNLEAFFLRLDPSDAEAGFAFSDDESLSIHVSTPTENAKLTFRKKSGALSMEEEGGREGGDPVRFAADRILEISLPYAWLRAKPSQVVTIAVVFLRKNVEMRRYSHIRFIVPDVTYEQRMWSV